MRIGAVMGIHVPNVLAYLAHPGSEKRAQTASWGRWGWCGRGRTAQMRGPLNLGSGALSNSFLSPALHSAHQRAETGRRTY
jgi:hypothetical protein